MSRTKLGAPVTGLEHVERDEGAADPDCVKGAVPAALARMWSREASQPLAAGLHLVATPIGNLADISIRALATLARADLVLCEDTRRTASLLTTYGIGARMRPLHDHNEERSCEAVVASIGSGRSIALASDAGTPLVSDPGYKLVRAVVAAGLPVHVVPGSSAALAALSLAALPSDRFLFAGFLPAKTKARRERIARIASVPATLVLFESPQRLQNSLADLSEGLGSRPAAIVREITKLHEEVVRGSLDQLAAVRREWLGEVVVVVGPPEAAAVGDEDIRMALAALGPGLSLKDAAREVAAGLGVTRGRAYEIGLEMRRTT